MTTAPIALPSREPKIALAALPPLSLYVHIPWCVRKCPYCDFNSHEARGDLPEQQYAQALMADLERALPSIWGRRVHTVFFGGGTPSLLSAKTLDEVLAGIRARVPLDPDAEVTLEANPGTFEAGKFAEFRRLGVNRLSVGVQSFNARHLKALGRIHDDHEARRAIEIARTHFDNINLDLMYALPEQTLLDAEADVATAVEFAPQHISFNLIRKRQRWWRGRPRARDREAECQDRAVRRVRTSERFCRTRLKALNSSGLHLPRRRAANMRMPAPLNNGRSRR
jgi:putative oxygen-independent coproporphyrinogen III oxidase